MIRAAGREAEKFGILGADDSAHINSMFEDVFKDPPWHLREQRREVEPS